MVRFGVLASGNGSNLQAILDAMAAGEIAGDLRIVIANQPTAKALQRAENAGKKALCIPHRDYASRAAFDAKLVSTLKAEQVDWVILAGFMRLLTKGFLDEFPNRVVNLHPSLLPAFPGVNAGQQALDYGVKLTGCTVHLVSEGMDSGPVIAQAAVRVRDDDDEQSLMSRLHQAEHQLLVEVVKGICESRVEFRPGAPGERAKVRFLRRSSVNGGP